MSFVAATFLGQGTLSILVIIPTFPQRKQEHKNKLLNLLVSIWLLRRAQQCYQSDRCSVKDLLLKKEEQKITKEEKERQAKLS